MLLTEDYSREKILQTNKSYIDENKEEIILIFGSVNKFLAALENIDPDSGSETVNTLFIWLKKKIITLDEIKRNEINKVPFSEFLSTLDILNRKKKLPDEMRDVRNYVKTRNNLNNLIKTVYKIDKEIRNKIKKEKNKGKGVLLFTGKNGTKFYESLDIVHSCYIGRGSKWCTAMTKNIEDNEFENIINYGFRIITFIPFKKYNPDNEKYQFNLYAFVENPADIPDPSKLSIDVFNRINEYTPLANLKDELYTDLIDFLFNEYEKEFKEFLYNYSFPRQHKEKLEEFLNFLRRYFFSNKLVNYNELLSKFILKKWAPSNSLESFNTESLKKTVLNSKSMFIDEESSSLILLSFMFVKLVNYMATTRKIKKPPEVQIKDGFLIGNPVNICDYIIYNKKPLTLIYFIYQYNKLEIKNKSLYDKITLKINLKTGKIENE